LRRIAGLRRITGLRVGRSAVSQWLRRVRNSVHRLGVVRDSANDLIAARGITVCLRVLQLPVEAASAPRAKAAANKRNKETGEGDTKDNASQAVALAIGEVLIPANAWNLRHGNRDVNDVDDQHDGDQPNESAVVALRSGGLLHHTRANPEGSGGDVQDARKERRPVEPGALISERADEVENTPDHNQDRAYLNVRRPLGNCCHPVFLKGGEGVHSKDGESQTQQFRGG